MEQTLRRESAGTRTSVAPQFEPQFSPRAQEILRMLNEIFDSLSAEGRIVAESNTLSFSP